MSQVESTVGVSAMSLYVPRFRVDLKDWCEWTGNPWEKIRSIVGTSFRVPAAHENVYTMAANAVLRLIIDHDVDTTKIGFLGLGTESSTDNAAGAVIVRGMVDRGLEALGRKRLPRNVEVPEFKHACLGGMYALKSGLRYVSADGKEKLAIVVSADVAEYERGSSGEQTQGAGAVAMLVEASPKLFSVDLGRSGNASDYRGPDFRKPFARHFHAEYAPSTARRSDFPVFSGRYSTFAYLDETVQAVEDMLRHQTDSAGQYYSKVHSLFFHRPYHYMPVQAMSFLYIRGLARGDHHLDELKALCLECEIDVDDVVAEALLEPDLYGGVLEGNMNDPYEATSKLAAALRRQPEFRELLEQKMSLGSSTVAQFGNLYSAALPAWIAAGLFEGASKKQPLTGAAMVAIGYGSGDAAEAWPITPVEGWESVAPKINCEEVLKNAITLSREQYEALHDRRELLGIDYVPHREFYISKVGKNYDQHFQDLGVEYYDYAG